MFTLEQQKIINHNPDRHAAVSAAPGSGKSTVLLERVKWLLANGVNEREILVLMFNKSAQEHFSKRLEWVCGADVEIRTFHSKGNEVCSMMMGKGVIPNRTLLSDSDAARPLAASATECAKDVLCKSEREDIAEQISSGSMSVRGYHPQVVKKIVARFKEICAEKGFMDFEDMIALPVAAAQKSEHARKMIFGGYRHILVDEFQDVSEDQIDLLQFLAGGKAVIMVVGDEDQAIYNWRGARPEYMNHALEERFGEVCRYTLSQTFRFGSHLAVASSLLIQRNTARSEKLCIAAPGKTTAIKVRMPRKPSEAIIERVLKWKDAGEKLSDVAVLVREFSKAGPAEVALAARAIPVAVQGCESFITKPVHLQLWAFLTLMTNDLPSCPDMASMWIRGFARGLMPNARSRLELMAKKNLMQAAGEAVDQYKEDAIKASEGFRRLNAQKMLNAIQAMTETVKSDGLLGAFKVAVKESGLWQYAGKTTKLSLESLVDEIKELVSVMEQIGVEAVRDNLTAHLERGLQVEEDRGECDRVLITSMHRSKGLEWPLVILPGLEEGVFPRLSSEIEDERRLFFVAATRAEKELLLIAPKDARLANHVSAMESEIPDSREMLASRFVYEMHLSIAQKVSDAMTGGLPGNSLPVVRENLDKFQGYIKKIG